jgi:hypothetical protein
MMRVGRPPDRSAFLGLRSERVGCRAAVALALLCGLVLACGGCRGERGAARRRSWASERTSGGQPAALAALMMPHAAMRAGLGAHRVKLYARLERMVDKAGTTAIEQSVELSVDSNGGFAGRKNTHRQYGNEVIWTGRKLYSRSRYGKFLERDPSDPDEPKRIAERIYGLLPAYLRLLEPAIELESGGHGTRAGRKAERLRLERTAEPSERPQATSPAREWRETVEVQSLSGIAWLDEQSGAALKVSLDARWTYALPAGPPPESGVPEQLDPKARGTMRLRLSQFIDQIGSVPLVSAPARRVTVSDERRLRLEIERQMVVGERPIPE